MDEHKLPNILPNITLDKQLADAQNRFQAIRSELTKLSLCVCLSFIFSFVLWSSFYSDSSIVKLVIISLLMSTLINFMPLWIVSSKLRELRNINKEIANWRFLISDYKNHIENKE